MQLHNWSNFGSGSGRRHAVGCALVTPIAAGSSAPAPTLPAPRTAQAKQSRDQRPLAASGLPFSIPDSQCHNVVDSTPVFCYRKRNPIPPPKPESALPLGCTSDDVLGPANPRTALINPGQKHRAIRDPALARVFLAGNRRAIMGRVCGCFHGRHSASEFVATARENSGGSCGVLEFLQKALQHQLIDK